MGDVFRTVDCRGGMSGLVFERREDVTSPSSSSLFWTRARRDEEDSWLAGRSSSGRLPVRGLGLMKGIFGRRGS